MVHATLLPEGGSVASILETLSNASDSDDSSSAPSSFSSSGSSRGHCHDQSMPSPSHLAASLPPTLSFDDDPSFIPHPEDPHSLRHAEFGHCEDQRYRATSVFTPGMSLDPLEEEPSYFIYLATCTPFFFAAQTQFLAPRDRSDRFVCITDIYLVVSRLFLHLPHHRWNGQGFPRETIVFESV